MNELDRNIDNLQKTIQRNTENIARLEASRDMLQSVERVLERDCSYLTVWHDGTISASFYFEVKDIPAEISPRLESLNEARIIPLEDWQSEDHPEERRRTFKASIPVMFGESDTVNLTIFLHATLADDALCRIEILGYEDHEVSEYVTVRKSVPITRLVCPGEDA